MVAKSSGSSSRKESWPRSVAISTKLTLAPAALRARTTALLSAVGNSQSDVKEATQKRVLVPRKAFASLPAVLLGEVEIVHRPRHVEVGVGVEAVDEARPLVAKIGFDLEVGVEAEGRTVAILEIASEFPVQRPVREIGDVRGHARHGEALPRTGAGESVAAGAPFRVGHDRLAADLVEGDVLRGMAGAGGDRQRAEDPLRIGRRPFQHLHAAERAAGDREERVDAEAVEEHRLGAHHVADRDHREVEAIGPVGQRIGRGRPGRPHAAADDVGADDEIAVGVDRLAGADHQIPPARLAGDRVGAGAHAGRRSGHGRSGWRLPGCGRARHRSGRRSADRSSRWPESRRSGSSGPNCASRLAGKSAWLRAWFGGRAAAPLTVAVSSVVAISGCASKGSGLAMDRCRNCQCFL